MIEINELHPNELDFLDGIMEEIIQHALNSQYLSIEEIIRNSESFDMGKTQLSLKERKGVLKRLPESAPIFACHPSRIDEYSEEYIKGLFEKIAIKKLKDNLCELEFFLEEKGLSFEQAFILDEDDVAIFATHETFELCGLTLAFYPAA
jgi:hypothetical protein